MKIFANAMAVVGILGLSMLTPTAGFAAYKCWNPAICKAICGKSVCGNVTAQDADIVRLDVKPKAVGGIAANTSQNAGYTCSNPAICIAVCGKKTC